MGRPQKYSAAEVREALHDAGGTVLHAAAMLGCDPSTVYRYVDRYTTVEQALNDARKQTYSEAVARVKQLMRDPEHPAHWRALKKVLETYGDTVADGLDWAERQRQDVDMNENLEFVVRYEDADEAD